jgi:hypothetical protein
LGYENSLEFYIKEFENKFLEISKSYYNLKINNYIENLTKLEYLKKIESIIENEEVFIEKYFYFTTKIKV